MTSTATMVNIFFLDFRVGMGWVDSLFVISSIVERSLMNIRNFMNKTYYVYIVTNKSGSTLYIGVTSNLAKRINQHKEKSVPGFTSKYNLNKLVYVELHMDVNEALNREKQLKKWSRVKKINLIKGLNPSFKDLSEEMD